VKHKSLTATILMLGMAIALSVWGDPTAIGISNASATSRYLTASIGANRGACIILLRTVSTSA
jgi:hypothetical protein